MDDDNGCGVLFTHAHKLEIKRCAEVENHICKECIVGIKFFERHTATGVVPDGPHAVAFKQEPPQ